MRRRNVVLIVVCVIVLLGSVVGVAAWLSLRQTAPSTFTAASASIRVDIGDAETTPLFTVSGMEPGDTATACFRAVIDLSSMDPATDARIYSGLVGGTGLADYLTITIEREDPVEVPTGTGGVIDCVGVTGTLTTLVPGPTLSGYGSLYSNYTAGSSLGTLTARRISTVDLKITMGLPLSTPFDAAGQTASASWIIEDA